MKRVKNNDSVTSAGWQRISRQSWPQHVHASVRARRYEVDSCRRYRVLLWIVIICAHARVRGWACSVRAFPVVSSPLAYSAARSVPTPRPIYPRLVNENIFCQWTDVSPDRDWSDSGHHVIWRQSMWRSASPTIGDPSAICPFWTEERSR